VLNIKSTRLQCELEEEDVMRAAITTLIATAAMTTTAFAANSAPVAEPGFLYWAFIGLSAAVLVDQTIPAVMLVIGRFHGLMTPPAANSR
jgi:FtsH-binding integral membrane protein